MVVETPSRATIESAVSAASIREFIEVARRIQGNDPCFVPPLLFEELKTLDPRKNPFFRHAEAAFWIARKEGRAVGRIAAVIDSKHNEIHRERCGSFGYFESENDPQTAAILLETASRWIAGRGAEFIRGPINLSLNHQCGLLVEGFDSMPAVMSLHNPPYYADLLEGFGLQMEKTLLAYSVQSHKIDWDPLERISQRVLTRGNFTLRNIRMNRFAEEIETVRRIYNAAWAQNWGFVPATREEFEFTAQGMKKILDPKVVWIAEKDGKPAGFSVPIPDIHPAIQAIGGRLLPFGIFRLPFLLKKISQVRVALLGVLPEYRSAGLEAPLLFHTCRKGTDHGYFSAECSWILEENLPMRRAIEKLNGVVLKRYRIYRKTFKK